MTTGTWDFPPQWWTQLRPGGRIVLPLSIRGIQHAQAVDGPVPEAIALYEALSGPAVEEPAGLWASSIAEVADLNLWLTLTEPGLTMDAGLRAISATLAMRAASPRADVTP